MKIRSLLLCATATFLLPFLISCSVSRKWVDINLVLDSQLTIDQKKNVMKTLAGSLRTIRVKPKDLMRGNYNRSFAPNTPDSGVNQLSIFIDSSLGTFVSDANKVIPSSRIRKAKLRRVKYVPCSCKDSLLWNIYGDLVIYHSGSSTPKASQPKPPPTHVNGGTIDYAGFNEKSQKPNEQESPLDDHKKLDFPSGFHFPAAGGFVAVIDTGIDSMLIQPALRQFILPYGEEGSRSTMPRENKKHFEDRHADRHGTSVTALMLKEYYRSSGVQEIPHVMVLRAMDDKGEGSLFSMCCAMSYAARASASLINISAGYPITTKRESPENGILNFYLGLCRQYNIPVVAAAGNTPGGHDLPMCRDTLNPLGILYRTQDSSQLFYPGAMSTDTTHYSIISVTGESATKSPCFFQNYDDELVTMGVVNSVNDTSCCAFKIPFYKDSKLAEGSSFATPIVSGRLAQKIMGRPRETNFTLWYDMLGSVIQTRPATSISPAKLYMEN